MYVAFNADNGGTPVNLFSSVPYLDIGLTVGDIQASFGLISKNSLTTILGNTSEYEAAKTLEGFSASEISNHMNIISNSPTMHAGLDYYGNLILASESIKHPDFCCEGTDIRKNISEVCEPLSFAHYLLGKSIGYIHNGGGDYHQMVVTDDKQSLLVQAWKDFTGLNASVSYFPGSTRFAYVNDTSDPNSGNEAGLNGWNCIYVEYMSPTIDLGAECIQFSNHCTSVQEDWTWNEGLMGWPYDPSDNGISALDITDYDQQNRETIIDSNSTALLKLYRMLNPTNSDDDATIIANLKAMTYASSNVYGFMTYLGDLAMVGRPSIVTGTFVKFTPAQYVSIGTMTTNQWYFRGNVTKLLVRQSRDILVMLAQDLVDSLPDGATKDEATNTLTQLGSSAEDLRGVIYAAPLNLVNAFDASTLATDYATMRANSGGPAITDQPLDTTRTYGDIKGVMDSAIRDCLVHFDISASEQAIAFDSLAEAKNNPMGHRMKYVCTTLQQESVTRVTGIDHIEIDGVTDPEGETLLGRKGVIYSAEGMSAEHVDLDVLATDMYSQQFWTDVLAAIPGSDDDALAPIHFVYDSNYLTVNKYPDVFAIRDDLVGQALIAYVGCSDGIVEKFFKLALALSPNDADFGLTFA
jgi:hypothetical protein